VRRVVANTISCRLVDGCDRLCVVTMPVIPIVEWAWRRQSVWSQTADAMKAVPHRFWQLRLGLTAAAAALALAGSQLKAVSFGASVALGGAAAVAMAAVGLLVGRRSSERVREWTPARSVSEAVKTEVFLFLTRSSAYEGSDREARLY
jgi:hypothetical protein